MPLKLGRPPKNPLQLCFDAHDVYALVLDVLKQRSYRDERPRRLHTSRPAELSRRRRLKEKGGAIADAKGMKAALGRLDIPEAVWPRAHHLRVHLASGRSRKVTLDSDDDRPQAIPFRVALSRWKLVTGSWESDDRCRRRIVPILKRAWAETGLPDEPPDAVLQRWASRTRRRARGTIALDDLAYRFTAHHLSNLAGRPIGPETARALVQAARKADKAAQHGALGEF